MDDSESQIRRESTQTDSSAPTAGESHTPGVFRLIVEGVGVFLLAMLLGEVVRHYYWFAPGVHDDRVLEWVAAGILSGEKDFIGSAGSSFSGHVVILWITLYAWQLDAFGQDPMPWHGVSHLIHSLSAAFLFVWMRSRGIGGWGSLVAATFWGAAAIARWDGSLLWRAGGLAPWIVLLLMMSLVTVGSMNARRYRMAGLLLVVLLWAMVLFWNVAYTTLLAIPTAYFLLSSPEAQRPRVRRTVIACWLSVFLLSGLLFAIISRGSSHPSLSLASIPTTLLRTPAMLSIGLADLTLWTGESLATQDLGWKISLAAIVTTACLVVAMPRGRRIFATIAVGVLGYVVAVNTLRGSLDLATVLTSGRYQYLPTLLWCVGGGVLIDGVVRRSRAPTWLPALAVFPLIVVFALHQWSVAAESVRQFDELWQDQVADFQAMRKTLDDMNELCESDPNLVFPDIPVAIPLLERECYWLSTLALVNQIEPRDDLRIVPLDEMTEEQIAQAERLGSTIGDRWSRTVSEFDADMEAVRWLEAFASRTGRVIDVPDRRMTYGKARPWLSECVEEGLAHPPKNLRFLDTPIDTSALLIALARESDPLARIWLAWLRETPTER